GSTLTRLSGLIRTTASTYLSSAVWICWTPSSSLAMPSDSSIDRLSAAAIGCPRYASVVSSRRACCASGCSATLGRGTRTADDCARSAVALVQAVVEKRIAKADAAANLRTETATRTSARRRPTDRRPKADCVTDLQGPRVLE